ncbi:CBO0543 family protein [Bacillus sp. SA1-12]|uniref:CBO0543 family protein n=1 Tax=Bacillus sp. SA1-12 TaxID=1455638 RepID=UPI001E647543|nr:CBO0543 family protein [Bacillus sp. SA1-12]
MSMHLAITFLTILASLRWGNWKDWKEYHSSMFFIATCGLLYEYIVQEYNLWEFHADWLFSVKMIVIIYAVITMPVSVFLFLSHFPSKWFQRIVYIIIWSFIYIAVEFVLDQSGRITYDHGWGIGYSFLFDIVMFSVIAFHQFYPVRAYIVSIFIISFLISYFHVPFGVFK